MHEQSGADEGPDRPFLTCVELTLGLADRKRSHIQ